MQRVSLFSRLDERFMQERGRWLLWAPVGLGLGIGLYFALPEEPPWQPAWLAAGAALLSLRFLKRRLWAFLPLAFGCCVCVGFAVAQHRAHQLAAPKLERDLRQAKGEGVIRDMERVQKGHRLQLEQVTLAGFAPERTPARIRLTVKAGEGLRPGQRVAFRAGLHPPPLPAFPGGYDFARAAWFEQVGAVGYAYGRPEVLAEPPSEGWREALRRLRRTVSQRVLEGLPPREGAVAISLMTAEQNAVAPEVIQSMRASGLAHILSISGLHMGLAIVILFGVVRWGLAAFPVLAMRYPIKKWAAAAALLGSAFYLGITGFPVPAVRSWLMAAFVLAAVMADRAQASMRFVALSAVCILLMSPEALLSVSFQLSYAATIGLIAWYEHYQKRPKSGPPRQGVMWRIWRVIWMTAAISVVAGICTAPYLIHHFQVANPYAVLANVLAEPLSALLIMPGIVLAFLLMPLGLESAGFLLLKPGIALLLALADGIAALPGAQLRTPTLPLGGMLAVTLGGLWLLLWKGRWRRWGIVAVLLGLAFMGRQTPPDVIASPDALAVRAGAGIMVLSGEDSYHAEIWLRSWGEGGEGKDLACDALGCMLHAQGRRIALPRTEAALREDCYAADFLVARFPLPAECGRWGNLDGWNLAAEGVVTVSLTPRGLAIASARQARGNRPWSQGSR